MSKGAERPRGAEHKQIPCRQNEKAPQPGGASGSSVMAPAWSKCRSERSGPGLWRLLHLADVRLLCLSPSLLLAKALQHVEVQPDLPAAPVLRIAESFERFLADPSLHPQDHDLMQPLASSVEASLEIGFDGRGLGGRLAAATARAPSEKSSSCRGFFTSAFSEKARREAGLLSAGSRTSEPASRCRGSAYRLQVPLLSTPKRLYRGLRYGRGLSSSSG
jgi:hypothetical protein